jgi:hypothetical protein
VLHLVALSRCAVIVRHWFEIDLRDCSLEHGARIELRELTPQVHRGSESAAQVVTLDRPLWRADVFDRVQGEGPGFSAAHYHPYFNANEPSSRVWDPALTADPWRWLADQFTSLGAASGSGPWPLDPGDAAELSGLADQIVVLARQFSPDRCGSPAECFRLTRDVRDTVQLMIDTVQQPHLLDLAWVSPWLTGSAAPA